MQNDAWLNGEQLEKPLANGDIAILLLNRLNTSIDITLNFEDVNDTSKRCWNVRDVWQGADLGRLNGEFVAQKVPPHGCRMLRLSDGAICAPPPPPPPPSCPEGYTAHESGFWRNTDPCNSNFTSCTEDHQNATVRTRVHLLPAFAVADKFSRTRAGNKMCEEVQRNEWLRCV